MNKPNTHDDALQQEGDVNLSPQRQAWQQSHLSDETRRKLADDARWFLRQSLSTPCLNAIVACEGIYLIDAEGRRIADFHGNSAHQVGYRHPRVMEAISRQLATLPFCPRRYANEPATELARRLAALAPGGSHRILFAPGGTSAMGIALKLVRYATGRHKTISMWGAFHGASLDAISIGGESLFRDGVGPLLPGCLHVDPPRADQSVAEAIAPMARILREEGDVAAVIAEPIRCTTVEIPPAGYWQAVRGLCDEHGALLVMDEIPLALGRTAKMFCCEHFGIEPDILVIGKGLGGAVMPMAAVIAKDSLDVVPDRALGHYTHEKNPLGAVAGLATLDIIRDENLLDRAESLGARAEKRLNEMARRLSLIRSVRRLGLSLGVELARDGAKAVDEAQRIMYGCLSRGLSFKVSDGNVLTLTPPLIITEQQLDEALDALEDAITDCGGSRI